MNGDFSLDKSNWGLWEFDVVEFFYRKPSEQEYHELQVSPLNQKFHLNIIKPREIFYSPIEFYWSGQVECVEDTWLTQIQIPHNGSEIEGNFHAMLGDPNKSRHYFSYKVNPQAQPDFHRPEYFVKL